MIRWTVLGSGTHIASARRGSPGHMVEVGGTKVLFDCGAGSFHGIARAGAAPEEIGAVFITHLHPDHTADLTPLLFRMRSAIRASGGAKYVDLIGPVGFATYMETLRALHAPYLETQGLEWRVREVGAGETRLPELAVRHLPVPHGVPALAYGVEDGEGARAVYSGDTGRSADLIRLARGADLLVIEASFPNGRRETGHLTPEEASAIAAEAGVAEMVLVHMNPECDEADMAAECGAAFRGRILVAEDGMVRVARRGGSE
ncbi:MAG: ribonuclease Z [Candidatus Eisenbacteria bacterium]|nr:ribonuclease Z [Candidatus Eisenbacteria bacterium]